MDTSVAKNKQQQSLILCGAKNTWKGVANLLLTKSIFFSPKGKDAN